MVNVVAEIIKALWIILPAYIANCFPTLTRLFFKKTHPIDFEKYYKGNRILGDGKTLEGLLFGLLGGWLISRIQLSSFMIFNAWFLLNFNQSIPVISLYAGLALIFGALIGDMLGSFIKRRLGMVRGQSFLFLDQLTFLVFALLFAFAFIEINIWTVIILLLITPIIHRVANIIGYFLKLKMVPW
jgi:CDP-2,3-bis-(O-geranylgeranyl)-sn-glycerol synthase